MQKKISVVFSSYHNYFKTYALNKKNLHKNDSVIYGPVLNNYLHMKCIISSLMFISGEKSWFTEYREVNLGLGMVYSTFRNVWWQKRIH